MKITTAVPLKIILPRLLKTNKEMWYSKEPMFRQHPNKKCLIHQREIGSHATSFAEALKASSREDPDLVLVGEMRDLETISMALTAAEKGTIVFGTLHTNNAAKTVDRIINVFPARRQDQVRLFFQGDTGIIELLRWHRQVFLFTKYFQCGRIAVLFQQGKCRAVIDAGGDADANLQGRPLGLILPSLYSELEGEALSYYPSGQF